MPEGPPPPPPSGPGVHIFTIPNHRPATTNELLGSHWAKAGRLKKRDRRFVETYAELAGIPPAAGKRRVHLVIAGPWRRRPDPDNLLKSTLDALVKAHLLIDDDGAHCEVGRVEFVRRASGYETTIILEDIKS